MHNFVYKKINEYLNGPTVKENKIYGFLEPNPIPLPIFNLEIDFLRQETQSA